MDFYPVDLFNSRRPPLRRRGDDFDLDPPLAQTGTEHLAIAFDTPFGRRIELGHKEDFQLVAPDR